VDWKSSAAQLAVDFTGLLRTLHRKGEFRVEVAVQAACLKIGLSARRQSKHDGAIGGFRAGGVLFKEVGELEVHIAVSGVSMHASAGFQHFNVAIDGVQILDGLNAGADDYIAKPSHVQEVAARLRALMRRAAGTSSPTLVHDDIELSPASGTVTVSGKPVDLTAQEFALLQLLAERQGEVLTRTFVTSQIWDMNFDSDTNVVDVAVKRLRAKIDNGFEKKLLHTVRGMGYVLEDRS